MKYLVHYWEGKNEDYAEFEDEHDAQTFVDNMNAEAPYCGASDPEPKE